MNRVRFLLIAVPFLLLFSCVQGHGDEDDDEDTTAHGHGHEDDVTTAKILYPLSIARAQELEALQRVIYNSTIGKFPTCSFTLFTDLVDFETAHRRCVEVGSSVSSIHDNRTNEEIRMLLNTAFLQNIGTIPHDEKPEDLEHPYSPLHLDDHVDEEHLKILLKKDGRDEYWGSDHWTWIGLSRLEIMDHAHARGAYHKDGWIWDGNGETPGKYENWLPEQPDQRELAAGAGEGAGAGAGGCPGPETCYETHTRLNHEGRWDDTFTFMTHPFVCSIPRRFIVSSDMVTWEEAKVRCAAAGLHLAKLGDMSEVNEVLEVVWETLGRTRDPGTFSDKNWVWVGGNDYNAEQLWEWLDLSLVEHHGLVWADKAGNDNSVRRHHLGQDVIALSKWGTIDDSYHVGKYRAYVCQCPET